MRSNLDWALDYMDAGYWIIPLLERSKKPAIAWKAYQKERPSYAEVESWWAALPMANIGLVCGAASGLVVIDADDSESESFIKIHLDPTPMRTRTRKGVHLYYRHPGGHVQSKARVILAVDKRADGGLATGIGSVHESGFVYALDEGARWTSLRDLPFYRAEWFPEARPVAPPGVIHLTTDVSRRAQIYVDAIPGAGAGARNESAFRVAAVVVRDFAQQQEEALAILSTWNDRCDPPLPFQELRDICLSAQKSGRKVIGNRLDT